MVKTRAMAEKEMEKLLALMQQIQKGQEEMKQSQEEMKQSQEEMKQGQESQAAKLEEMKQSQAEMKDEMQRGQEEMQTNIVNVISDKVDAIAEKVEQTEERLNEIEKNFKGDIETIEKKLEGEIQAIEKKFEHQIEKIMKEIKEEVPEKSVPSENVFQKVRTSLQIVPEITQHIPMVAKPSIKLATYDGKSSWKVYKTQFSIVAEANGWDSLTKARQLAASLREEAADILRTVPEDQQLNFDILSSALELRFGEKCLKDYSRLQLKSRQQRQNETLQELATDVERLSHLAFPDCPADVRDTLSLQYFIDGVRDVEIQKALRLAELKDLKSALVYAMKFEAAQQASRRDRHMARGAEVQPTDNALREMTKAIVEELRDLMSTQVVKPDRNTQKKAIKCWKCGTEGHIQRNCQARHDQRGENTRRSTEQEN